MVSMQDVLERRLSESQRDLAAALAREVRKTEALERCGAWCPCDMLDDPRHCPECESLEGKPHSAQCFIGAALAADGGER